MPKNQMAAKVVIIVSFKEENWQSCPLLILKRNNYITWADIWCLVIIVFSHQPIQWKGRLIEIGNGVSENLGKTDVLPVLAMVIYLHS